DADGAGIHESDSEGPASGDDRKPEEFSEAGKAKVIDEAEAADVGDPQLPKLQGRRRLRDEIERRRLTNQQSDDGDSKPRHQRQNGDGGSDRPRGPDRRTRIADARSEH